MYISLLSNLLFRNRNPLDLALLKCIPYRSCCLWFYLFSLHFVLMVVLEVVWQDMTNNSMNSGWVLKLITYLVSPIFFFWLLKVVLSTLAFTAFELPPNGAIGTKILEFLFHSRSDLVRTFFLDIFNTLHVITCLNHHCSLVFCFNWNLIWNVLFTGNF